MASIGNLNAKITADAKQFVAEFARADNAARRSSVAIDREVATLTRNIKKKFSASDVGKDLLRGLGIGSGFAAAQMAAEQIAGFWERAANAAKAIEESTAKALDATLKGIKARQTPDQQLTTLQKEFSRKGAELEAARQPQGGRKIFNAFTGLMTEIPGKVDQERVHALAAEYAALGVAVEEAQRKINADTLDKAAKVAQSSADLEEALARERMKTLRDDVEAGNKIYLESLAEREKIAAAAARSELDLWEDTANARRAALQKEIEDGNKIYLESLEKKQKIAEENSLEIERIVGRGADGIADAMVDSLSGVEGAWSDLGNSIVKELARIAYQVLVVKPLINSLGGIMGGIGGGIFGTLGAAFSSYGGGKAGGGAVEGGVTYRVNEQGQEFFKSDQGGTIIPAGIARGMSEGRTQAGMTVFIDATGADAGAVARLEATVRSLHGSIERRAVAAVVQAKRRGGGMAAALA